MTKKEKKIYEQCSELLKNNQLQHMSMDDIAAFIPVSKMTIYKYFDSREVLMEKVLLFFLETLIVGKEYQGIEKMEQIFISEVQKANINRDLMMSIMKQGSDEFISRIEILQSLALEDLQVTFSQCIEKNYFSGFTFDEFLKMYGIYIQGVISDSNTLSVKECLDLFTKLVISSSSD